MNKYKAKFTKKVSKFVGLQIEDYARRLAIHQKKMIQELSAKSELILRKDIETPMIENMKWNDSSVRLHDIKPQQVLIGELMYLNMCTRPDISYAVNRVARTTARATKETYRAAKRILQYVYNTMDLQLQFNRWDTKSQPVLEVFSDSSFADIVQDGYKSTGGFIITLNGNVVGWKSYKIKWACA